jgi:Family of unknown function (DUF6364)
MEKQNLTLSLPKDLIRRAKIQAARENMSLSRYTMEAVEEKLGKSTGYANAKKRHLKALSSSVDLGTKGNLGIARESMHERG